MEKLGRIVFSNLMVLVAVCTLSGCTLETKLFQARTDGASVLPSTFAVQLSSAATSPHGPSTFSVNVDFGSEVVSGLTVSDFVVVNGTATNLVDAGAGTSFTLDINPSGSGDYVVTVQLPASVTKNAAGDDNGLSNLFSLNIDGTGPTIQISSPSPTSGVSGTSFVYTVTYTDADTVNLTNGHISLNATVSTGCSANVTNGTTATPTVTISGCTNDGSVNFSINADSARDIYNTQAAAFGPSSSATIRDTLILTYDTRNVSAGSPSDTVVELGLNDWLDYEIVINWGDGTAPQVVNSPGNQSRVISHTYLTGAGIYNIKISGANLPYLTLCSGNVSDEFKLIDVKQWGPNPWWKAAFMFKNCRNVQISAADAPNLASIEIANPGGEPGLRGMFQGATNFNSNINHWTVSNIRDMSNMFEGAEKFNQPLNSWITSSSRTMRSMFSGAKDFNQNIGSWNTTSVTDMGFMFYEATSFDSPLPWNTANVTTMDSMFAGATLFNQDISSWTLTSITNMDSLFKTTATFNQDLSGWVLPMGVSHNLYDDFAVAWEAQHKPTFP